MTLVEYRKRSGSTVFALQLDLETKGFDYFKWDEWQHCKQGDWLVKNGEDTYTVDRDVFARTYKRVGAVEFEKTATVWAEQAPSSGTITTKEGATQYQAGDYLVYNDREQTDGYAISRAKFEEMYERVRTFRPTNA